MAADNRLIDESTSTNNTNKFELLLFRLGAAPGAEQQHETYGINVFKIREIIQMPDITPMAGASEYVLGAVNIRGQVMSVIDLPKVMGCNPTRGLNLLLVTEFARSTQAFAVEEVDDIVRLEWNQVLSAETSVGGSAVTSIARIDSDTEESRLAQVVDIEQVMRDVFPALHPDVNPDEVGKIEGIPAGTKILAADDSGFARKLIEDTLKALGLEYIMAKTGREAWNTLQSVADDVARKGGRVRDRIALVLTDIEMPEMGGFMLTRQIRADTRMSDIPVVIHSSLTGAANEAQVRSAGATGYIAKFAAAELGDAIRKALTTGTTRQLAQDRAAPADTAS